MMDLLRAISLYTGHCGFTMDFLELDGFHLYSEGTTWLSCKRRGMFPESLQESQVPEYSQVKMGRFYHFCAFSTVTS